jgi:metal-sulfur cluster biosynthetic enzyme
MPTEKLIWEKLKTVMDPELNIDIVSLGLIYEVKVTKTIQIVMTLTTPGCPLAGVFDTIVKDSLRDIDGLDVEKDVSVELTFDPPWTTDMMSEESRAELGF